MLARRRFVAVAPRITRSAARFAYDATRTEVRLLQATRVLAVACLSLIGVIGPFEPILGAACGVLFGWKLTGALAQRLSPRLVRRWHARLAAAFADPPQMRRLLDDLDGAYRAMKRLPDSSLRIQQGLVFLAEERWSDARAALQDVAPSSEWSLDETLIFENAVAWILAHDGAAGDAVEKAEQTLARALKHPTQLDPELLGYLHETLGAALCLDARPADAILSLRRAIAAGGNDVAQATRYYYLGMALTALVQLDEARQALTQACTLAPATRWARLAGEQLALGQPAPYR